MKRLAHIVSAVALAGVLMLSPVDMPAGQAFSITAYAHGSHHGNGHHGNSAPDYYYCNGHEAHHHNNGVCPYADSEYYYCDGHEAHLHDNGICPYAASNAAQSAPAASDNSDDTGSLDSTDAPDPAAGQSDNVTSRRSQKRYISQNISDVICMYNI